MERVEIIITSFSYLSKLVAFYCDLSVNNFLKVSWKCLSIVADLKSVVDWMIFLPMISNSSCFLYKHMGSFPSVLITIYTPVIFTLHNFFCSLARSQHLHTFSVYFIFTLGFAETAKSTRLRVLFFLLINTGSGL